MPATDTDVIFALNPDDRLHKPVLRTLKKLRESGEEIYTPAAALLEFMLVLRALGRSMDEISRALLAMKAALELNNIKETCVIDAATLAQACELETMHGLSLFDSLIAASALKLDRKIISTDKAYDKIHGLKRIDPTE